MSSTTALASAVLAGKASFSSVAAGFAALCVCALLCAWAYTHNERKRVSAPGPPEYPIIQSLPFLLKARQHLLETVLESTRKYGVTWTLKWPFSPRTFMVSSPPVVEHVLKTRFDNYVKGPYFHSLLEELLGDGIFNSDGERWHVQRKMAANLFSVRQFRDKIMDAFRRHGVELEAVLERAATTGEAVDMQALFFRFTLDSIGDIAFGDTIGAMADPKVPFARAFDAAQAIVEHRFISPGWQLFEILDGTRAQLKEAVRIMDEYSYNLIRKRRETRAYERGQDLLSRFMHMQDDDGNFLYLHDDKFLRDVIMNFMIAGRDTTAQALSWSVYQLSQHPEAELVLAEEARRVLGLRPITHADIAATHASDTVTLPSASVMDDAPSAEDSAQAGDAATITYETVARQLKYTQAALQETLRLCPSVPKDVKSAVADDTLPDGTFVPAGSLILYLPHTMGHLDSNWPDAEKYDPQRFLRGEKYSQYKFIAFNAGPRTCLGQHMALVEASFVLGLIFRKFTLKVLPDQEITYLESLTLPMKNGIKVTVHRRT